MWSNQYLAYDSLSDGLKRVLSGLRGRFYGVRLARLTGMSGGEQHTSSHPIVRTHPETGRKALLIGNPIDTMPHFEDMTREESFPLIKYLYEHSSRPDRTYRHVWQEGDVVMWDNRCTMHYAVHDYGEEVRQLNRVTIKGSEPV